MQNILFENKTGVSQAEMSRIITNCKNTECDKTLNFEPFLYNLWNAKKDNSITHFGNIPQVFVENFSAVIFFPLPN